MNLSKLQISGNIHSDPKILAKFSKDASSYRILPALVAEPKSDDDILKIIQFAKDEGLSITSRAGGSGLSGAGIGKGIILNFKKYLNRVLSIGEETVVQPGTILDKFLKQMEKMNLMIPSIPSSSSLCALGGNMGTRSTGPRTARYGTIDDFVTSLKFITARGEIVDTQKPLPEYLDQGLREIRQQFLSDRTSQEIIVKRPFIAGGYNLKALAKYDDTRELATHLMVSSVGTLAIVTEIRLKLMENKPSQGTFVAHFRDGDEFAEAANRLKVINPSALEFSDASCSRHVNGKILNYSDPTIAATLIVEFDESKEQARQGKEIIESYDISQMWNIQPGSANEAAMWEDRRRILPSLWKYARENKKLLPSIIDDVAIHLKDFGVIQKEITESVKKFGLEISYFGHLGFGSIHARPYFDLSKGDLIEQIMDVSQETFKILQKYNGTLVGEHNAGRSRSVYLEQDLRSAYKYMRMIKNLFDPDDILNPGTVFNTEPIYVNMDLMN